MTPQILIDHDVDPSSPINLRDSERILRAHANWIATQALNGDGYSWSPIGDPGDSVDDMEVKDATLRLRAQTTSDVAIWERADGTVVLIADANGPVAIEAGPAAE